MLGNDCMNPRAHNGAPATAYQKEPQANEFDPSTSLPVLNQPVFHQPARNARSPVGIARTASA